MMSDERPEVRNTAVRTLFLVVSSQGSRLSDMAWEEVAWQLLFPLLRSVHHMAATSSREEVMFWGQSRHALLQQPGPPSYGVKQMIDILCH